MSFKLLILFIGAAGAKLVPRRSANAIVIDVGAGPNASVTRANGALGHVGDHLSDVTRVRCGNAITNFSFDNSKPSRTVSFLALAS